MLPSVTLHAVRVAAVLHNIGNAGPKLAGNVRSMCSRV